MNEIERLLKPLPHNLQVIFAVHCCNDIKYLMDKESSTCLELVEKRLATPHLVSKEELNNAANAATSVYDDAASAAAYYAAYAANAISVYAAYAAASAASYAANATAYAAASAVSAASAASYAANAISVYAAYAAASTAKRKEKLKQYEAFLIQMIDNLTDLEKTIYNLGGLQ